MSRKDGEDNRSWLGMGDENGDMAEDVCGRIRSRNRHWRWMIW